jgi:hypothetical protein
LVLVCVPRRAGCWGVTEVRPPFISVLFFVSCQVRYGTNKLQPPIEHQEISLQVQMQSSSKTVFGDYRGIHRRTESAYQPTRNMSVFAPRRAVELAHWLVVLPIFQRLPSTSSKPLSPRASPLQEIILSAACRITTRHLLLHPTLRMKQAAARIKQASSHIKQLSSRLPAPRPGKSPIPSIRNLEE